jgi:hypothetical protein
MVEDFRGERRAIGVASPSAAEPDSSDAALAAASSVASAAPVSAASEAPLPNSPPTASIAFGATLPRILPPSEPSAPPIAPVTAPVTADVANAPALHADPPCWAQLKPCSTSEPAAPAAAAQPMEPTPAVTASQPAKTAVETTNEVMAAAWCFAYVAAVFTALTEAW